MVNLLVGIIVVQFVYILYQDFVNRREREKLQLLLKSETATEFKVATTTPKLTPKQETKPNPFIPLEEVPFEKLIKAEDKL